jgi:hypothetical protein
MMKRLDKCGSIPHGDNYCQTNIPSQKRLLFSNPAPTRASDTQINAHGSIPHDEKESESKTVGLRVAEQQDAPEQRHS